MRVKETQPPASEGPASRAVVLDKPLFQTHPLCTSVPPSRKMSIGRQLIILPWTRILFSICPHFKTTVNWFHHEYGRELVRRF